MYCLCVTDKVTTIAMQIPSLVLVATSTNALYTRQGKLQHLTLVNTPGARLDKDVSRLQLSGLDIGLVVKRYMEVRGQPEAKQIKGFSQPASRALYQQWVQFKLKDGTLYRQFESQDRGGSAKSIARRPNRRSFW